MAIIISTQGEAGEITTYRALSAVAAIKTQFLVLKSMKILPSKCLALANQYPTHAPDITNYQTAYSNPKCVCAPGRCECLISETDFLVWDKAIGLVIIEVKAVSNKKSVKQKVIEATNQINRFERLAHILYPILYPGSPISAANQLNIIKIVALPMINAPSPSQPQNGIFVLHKDNLSNLPTWWLSLNQLNPSFLVRDFEYNKFACLLTSIWSMQSFNGVMYQPGVYGTMFTLIDALFNYILLYLISI